MELREDISGFRVRLDDETVARWTASGIWRNRTLADYARQRVREEPDTVLYIDNGVRLTRHDIYDKAMRLATALRARGLSRGDVISMQLPNWHETAVVHLAAAIEGFVVNPIVPLYRDAEVGFILGEARAKAIFIPGQFRNFDYRAMMRRLRAALPALQEIIVVRDGPDEFTAFEELLAIDPAPPVEPVDPNAIKMVMYTSGTTGPAKGVLHSHNSTMVEIDHYGRVWELGPQDRIYMASPLCHATGLFFAVEVPWVHGYSAVLADKWDAAEAVATMRAEQCTLTVGATIFLQETLAALDASGDRLPDLRLFLCGGASVPPSLVSKAQDMLPQTLTMRLYGSTEAPTITYGVLLDRDDREHAARTDGRIVDWDVKICDAETGATLPPGSEGEILARGAEMMLGYSRVADTIAAFDDEGFFRTGDIGRIVDDHFLLITDRKKDIIIRGGENLSAREIEEALLRMPGVPPLAVVGMPCARMGEAVCAVFESEAPPPSLEAIAGHLEALGMSKRKFPERAVSIDRLPRTASGKLRKDVLRRSLAKSPEDAIRLSVEQDA